MTVRLEASDGETGGGAVGAGAGAGSPSPSELSAAVAVVASFVAGFEPARYTGADAESLVATFAQGVRVCEAGKTLAARRAAEALRHRASGHRTPAQWLASLTGDSVGDAIDTLALGDTVEDHPGMGDAFRQGKLSRQRAKAVGDAVRVNPQSEDELVGAASSEETLRQLRDRCARAKAQGRSRRDEEARQAALHAARRCRTWIDQQDGAFCLDARLAPDVGARVKAALEHEADRIFHQARTDDLRESSQAYAADALVNLLCGENDGGPRASRSSVHVRIDLDALRNGEVGEGQLCEIPGVGPIPVERAREIMGDALTRFVITDGIDVSTVWTPTRTIPVPLRQALLERDPVCVVPGCDQAARLEIDHWQIDYSDDGPTAWWNLCRLCVHHHRLKTANKFRLEGGPGRWRYVPHGAEGGKGATGGGRSPGAPGEPDPPAPPGEPRPDRPDPPDRPADQDPLFPLDG